MKSKRIRLADRTLENDIKYSGFLSYRHVRIIAWACLILSQIAVILSLQASLNPTTAEVANAWKQFFLFFADLPLPLFLLANFSDILRKKENYRQLFIFYGGVALGLYLLSNFLVFHYGFRTLHSLDSQMNWGETARIFGIFLEGMGKSAYVLNIFIDLVLCSLLFFFMNYTPKSKVFEGKKIFFFRLLVLLPIAYEVGSIIIKYNMYEGTLNIPSYVFFLLTSKPPFVFLAFIVIVFGLKIGQHLYLKKHDNNIEQYNNYSKTNAYSLRVSIMIAIIFAVVALMDLILTTTIIGADVYNITLQYPDDEMAQYIAIHQRVSLWNNIGLGGSISMFAVAPIAILFSYTKTHKNKIVDTIIPVAGIGLILIVYIEGVFEVITCNMPFFIERLKDIVQGLIGGGESAPPVE